jgi:hypothetical protein
MIYKLTSSCITIEHSCVKTLSQMAADIINKNPDICHLRGSSDVFNSDSDKIIDVLTLTNHSPTVDSNGRTVTDNTYTFQESDFKLNFTDIDGDLPEDVMINSLPSRGTLEYDGNPVVTGLIFNITDSDKLVYTRSIGAYTDSFIFQTSDNNITNKLFSNMANFTINVAGEINQPPTIGDGATSTDYGTNIVFTRAMFTTATTPPYSDPEGDAALTLRIMTLPTNGNIKLSGVNISAMDEFDFTTDIDSGNLTYVGDPGVTTAQALDFTFAIADAGSGIFVT